LGRAGFSGPFLFESYFPLSITFRLRIDGNPILFRWLIQQPQPTGDFPMGELTDKAKAAGNKAAGAIKEAIGKNQRDPDLVAEGQAQKAKGTAQDIKGSIKGALGDKI
jgi:uncharacterized protein YjbJ (UPF0337 family)